MTNDRALSVHPEFHRRFVRCAARSVERMLAINKGF